MAALMKPAKDSAKLKIFESESDVSNGVCEFVIEEARKAIEKHGRFTIGLSGIKIPLDAHRCKVINYHSMSQACPNLQI